MRVAIVGAGLAGLSCAFELEKHGIIAAIFEKRSNVGEPAGYTNLWSNLVFREYVDPFKYLKRKYNLSLTPLTTFRKVKMVSPRKEVIANGNLGYFLKRGVNKDSIEQQIFSKIKSPIIFNTFIELDDIKNRFDHIVVATASPAIAKQMNIWTDTFVSQTRIATVLGNFDTSAGTIWFNEKFANKAFAYLIPNSLNEATLTLITNGIAPTELDYYWNKFMNNKGTSYTKIIQYDTEHSCGFVKPYKVGNIYFAGNAGGFTDDLVGIGGFNAIETGILAAQAISTGIDYNKLIKPISDDIVKLHEFRKLLNTFDNKSFDRLIGFIGIPGIKQFIYNNPLLKIQQATPLVRLYNNIKKN